jgi:predicted PurR-regulated permease PerM
MSRPLRHVSQIQIFLVFVVALVTLMLTVASLTYAAEGPPLPATQQQVNDLTQQMNDLKGDLKQQISELKGITTRLDDTNAWLRGLTWVAGGSAAAIVIALVTAAFSLGKMATRFDGLEKRFDERVGQLDKQITRLQEAADRMERSRP